MGSISSRSATHWSRCKLFFYMYFFFFCKKHLAWNESLRGTMADRRTFNVVVLGLGFLFIFTAFTTCGNIEVSLFCFSPTPPPPPPLLSAWSNFERYIAVSRFKERLFLELKSFRSFIAPEDKDLWTRRSAALISLELIPLSWSCLRWWKQTNRPLLDFETRKNNNSNKK